MNYVKIQKGVISVEMESISVYDKCGVGSFAELWKIFLETTCMYEAICVLYFFEKRERYAIRISIDYGDFAYIGSRRPESLCRSAKGQRIAVGRLRTRESP